MARTNQIVAAVPFTAAAHEHLEPAFKDTRAMGGSSQQLNPINLPAFGFLRHVYLDIQATGGVDTNGDAAGSPDYPFNIIQSLTLLDVNGAPIVGPVDGYALYQLNKIGGYAYRQDPRDWPGFSDDDTNPRFQVRVPVEIAHYNALGALANQNAAAPYQLLITLASADTVWDTAPATLPDVTITGHLECWTLPAATDVSGRPQEQLPPAHGTGQFWSARTADVIGGNQTVPITRVGNLIRNLVFIARDPLGVRDDDMFPDPIIINWDGRQLVNESKQYRINAMFERMQGARDEGVFAYTFNHSSGNKAGDDTPNLWLPTVQATRMEVTGNFGGSGSVQVLVNDIQPIEVNPAARYAESNATSPAAQGHTRAAQNVQQVA